MKLAKLLSKSTLLFDNTPTLVFAVAKDENNSSKGWQIAWERGRYAKYKAKRALKDKGFSKIEIQSGHEECGHFLKRGFWVVIKSERTDATNDTFVSYGMGADTGNYTGAEEKALVNLKLYDNNWKEEYGYHISKKGPF